MNQDYLHELMNTLVSAARVSLEPLDSHFIASGDAAFKDDYLTLLAALLLENGALNDAQQRLLLLLLPQQVRNSGFLPVEVRQVPLLLHGWTVPALRRFFYL